MVNDNWRDLILNAGTSDIDLLNTSKLGWRHTIDAKATYMTGKNTKKTIDGTGISGAIGLLAVEIIGSGYWVLVA